MKILISLLLFCVGLFGQCGSGGANAVPGANAAVVGTDANGCLIAATANKVSAPLAASGVSGSGTAQTLTFTPTVASLSDQARFSFRPSTANTGTTPTITVGSTTCTVTKSGGTSQIALAANDWITGALAEVKYNGTTTNCELQNPQTAVGGSSSVTCTVYPVNGLYSNGAYSNVASAGLANYATAHAVYVPCTSSGFQVDIHTASGTSCTGGQCGYIAGMFAYSSGAVSSTPTCVSTPLVSGGSPDINATGFTKVTWTAPCPAGRYIFVESSDSAVLSTNAIDDPLAIATMYSSIETVYNGYHSAGSTGNGSGIAFANMSGFTWIASGFHEPFILLTSQ